MNPFLVFVLLLFIVTLRAESALAQPVDSRCTATLTAQGPDYLLKVPLIVPIVASATPDSGLKNYSANFMWAPSLKGLEMTLDYAAESTEQPPFNCPAPELTTDSAGSFSLLVPNLSFENNVYFARLQQRQPGSNTFSVMTTGPAAPPAPKPSIALRCLAVVHFGNHSTIIVSATFTSIRPSASANLVANSTAGPITVKYYRYDATGTMLTEVVYNYDIYSYGSYNGDIGISTEGGFASVSWDIVVTAASIPCSGAP